MSKVGDASEDTDPLVTWFDDNHEESGRPKAQEIVSRILQDSHNQYTAALETLVEREWQINGRMICGVAGVIRDSHLASLETHTEGQAAVMQWHAKRAAGEWEEECIAMMNKMSDVDFCKRCALTTDTALTVTSVNSQDDLAEIIQHRAQRLFDLCVCLVSKRCWTMKRLSLCPPYCCAGIMHERASVAKTVVAHVKTLNHCVELAAEMVNDELDPPKLKDLLADLYFSSTVLHGEIVELLEKGSWSYKHCDTRAQLWEIFCGVSQTKKVLEDMFGRLKDITTRQNRNRRISLHRISIECSNAATLQDENSGKLVKLTAEDFNVEIAEGLLQDITDGLFQPQEHELEGNLQDSSLKLFGEGLYGDFCCFICLLCVVWGLTNTGNCFILYQFSNTKNLA